MADELAPSYELIPGSARSPVILHVPHSSRVIPAALRPGIVLTDSELEDELDHITDSHTAELAAAAAGRAETTPWQFVNGLSRLVVDPERFPDEREEMLTVGMGAVYTRTTRGQPLRPPDSDPAPLISRYFHPYARAMTAAVADRLAATGRAVVIDVHSYPSRRLPYELHGEGARPPICLGADGFHTTGRLLALARAAFARCGDTAVNTPFAGTYVPLDFYGKDARVTALMVEIRRDLYLREPGGPMTAGSAAVARALTEFVDTVGVAAQGDEPPRSGRGGHRRED